VANGDYDWDQKLFDILPKVKKAENREVLSKIFLEWIDGLGKVKACKKCHRALKTDYFNKNFDLNWMQNNQLFTPELSERLRYIEKNRHQGKKHFIRYYNNRMKIAHIINEEDYKDFDWREEKFRLLSLFRYWNIIEYFFPAKYQIDKDWDSVLLEMITRFLEAKTETDLHLAMVELAVSIDDSHVRLNTQKTYEHFGIYYLPVRFKIIDNNAVVTECYNDSIARLNDLRVGDVITKANGIEIREIYAKQKKYISGSNELRKRFNAEWFILNGPSQLLEIEVVRNGKVSRKKVSRYLYGDFGYEKRNDFIKQPYGILKGDIGYVNVFDLEGVEVQTVMDSLKYTKAIIFDTRRKMKASMFQFANYFTFPSKGFYKAIYPDLDYPGRFLWTKVNEIGTSKELSYKGKVVLLVDEGCQSQCEFVIMGLQTGNNVTTIGSQSSGANGNVVIFNMVGGFKTQISGVGIFYPNGMEMQRKGVKLDIEVSPTIRGIQEGKDEILERALEFVRTEN
jgi:C-terminal processing protease CtpA/Prc